MTTEELNEFIQKYRNQGLLVDTNLLTLLWVGRWNRPFISKHKRTNQFDDEAYERLEILVSSFSKIVVTPCVLAEATNLVRQGAGNHLSPGSLSESLIGEITRLDEHYIESTAATDAPGFIGLGLTDAGICVIARGKFLVATCDLDLYVQLCTEGIDAINFSHLRDYSN